MFYFFYEKSFSIHYTISLPSTAVVK